MPNFEFAEITWMGILNVINVNVLHVNILHVLSVKVLNILKCKCLNSRRYENVGNIYFVII